MAKALSRISGKLLILEEFVFRREKKPSQTRTFFHNLKTETSIKIHMSETRHFCTPRNMNPKRKCPQPNDEIIRLGEKLDLNERRFSAFGKRPPASFLGRIPASCATLNIVSRKV